MKKICKKCNTEKNAIDFDKGRNACKVCQKESRRKLREKNNPNKRISSKSEKENHKICIKCGEEKHVVYFTSNYSSCKRCNGEKMRNYRHKNATGYIYSNEMYIYIVINDAWKDYIKLGRSVDYEHRLGQYQTYSPHKDYKMYFNKVVKDVGIIEGYFNKNFSHSNEWFLVDKDEAVGIIKKLIQEHNL